MLRYTSPPLVFGVLGTEASLFLLPSHVVLPSQTVLDAFPHVLAPGGRAGKDATAKVCVHVCSLTASHLCPSASVMTCPVHPSTCTCISAFISFHSLEDELVRARLKSLVSPADGPGRCFTLPVVSALLFACTNARSQLLPPCVPEPPRSRLWRRRRQWQRWRPHGTVILLD